MKFKGWKQIFSFNYIQYVKSKSFIVSTIIISVFIALIAAAVNIVPVLVTGGSFDGIISGEEEKNPISRIYLLNETDYPTFDFDYFDNMEITCTEQDADTFKANLENISKSQTPQAAVELSPVKDAEGRLLRVNVTVFRPEDKEVVSKAQAEEIGSLCAVLLRESILQSIGVDKENIYLAEIGINTDVQIYGSGISSEVKEVVGIIVPMFSALIMFMFIVSYAQIIAQSVAQEKTSRVIELLITSVRPLAIIVGKVLSMLLVVITQIAIIGAVSGIAFAVTMPFGITSKAGQLVDAAASAMGEVTVSITETGTGSNFMQELTNALPGLFNPMAIITIVIVFVLGFLFYALLAGLVGAGVSRTEDLASAIQPLMLVAVAGFFLSYMSSAFNYDGEGNAVMVLSRYIPISSPFALPASILTGEMSAVETGISVLFLAILTALMAMLVAKVYENIILYSGSPLKLGQIIKMAGSKKQ